MADKHAVSFRRGDSYEKIFTFTDKLTGEPISLTGYTAKMTVDTLQDPMDDTTKVFEVVGVILDQITNKGKISFKPTSADTGTVGEFFYDIQLSGPDSSIRTPVKSTFSVTMDITK